MRSRRRRAWIAAALLLPTSGCVVGPDFVRPEPPAPPSYTAEPIPTELSAGGAAQHLGLQREISSEWWDLFHSRPLDAVIERGLAGNPSLAAARATLAQAEESVAAARGSLFPQLDLGAHSGRGHVPGLRSNQPSATSSLYSVGPSVSYLVDV